MTGKLAEVTAASSANFTAQCYGLYQAPPLGTLVRAGEDPSVYGVVCNVGTGPADPGRRVLPRGEAEEDEAKVYRNNPQLERLLATTFEALIVGYEAADGPKQGLPSLPPRVHAFVTACSPTELIRFTRDFRFLRLLLQASPPAADEVVMACLRQAITVRSGAGNHDNASSLGHEAFLLQAGRALARELAGDAARLSTLLRGLTL